MARFPAVRIPPSCAVAYARDAMTLSSKQVPISHTEAPAPSRRCLAPGDYKLPGAFSTISTKLRSVT